MSLMPELTLSWRTGLWLLLPLIAIRFGLMGLLDRQSLTRAAHFPRLLGAEQVAFRVYMPTNLLLIFYLPFLTIKLGTPWFYIGLLVYLAGVTLLTCTVIDFARPNPDGLLDHGVYRFSRHPMYLSYLVFYLGCGLMTASWLYLGILVLFQASTHWIAISEERWCVEQFGSDYAAYTRQVNRYMGRRTTA
jgi:protein-S-isoprenylcysteine O-methyltransferase Ste14